MLPNLPSILVYAVQGDSVAVTLEQHSREEAAATARQKAATSSGGS